MKQVSQCVATFLKHTPVRFAPLTDEEAAALDSLLIRAWEDACAQWPTVKLSLGQFVIHVAERLPKVSPDSPIAPLLTKLSLAELYLTCGCLQGLASAHEAFEKSYLAKLPGKLRGLRQPDAMIDDVCQITRVKLLVATPESAPRIGEYTGRGALLSWVLVTAGRIANKLRAAEKPASEDSAEEVLKMLPGQGIDPELDVMKRRHHAEFRQAVHEAASTLSADERHLLRLHFADQLSTYELASLFRVNQSTVSRWLKSARQRVYEETRQRLQERLGLSTLGFKSFLAFIDSQLDMNISQILEEKG
ncbi:sigma-70 family RNA polymerase sigma factor [Corallococcus sp. BB11-1]|uniref:sigma-70 family RNA polymerase sigma factor n=1 Tax=Corallococcus sp. BB11-1 TaxID=2996783 RepID=UPI0010E8FA3C|nr:sigma-70 family RNA polymerase sigma factor [Corallococcus sp. BB11-1]MCY1034257.1 sigma-70 family RNA polymerase sigma factor [Corallococcus sp. BB11-1]RYZ16532.1 MAG: sigma-70 family RNA polymerase sigma factor [Myxococcaceae bacterium]